MTGTDRVSRPPRHWSKGQRPQPQRTPEITRGRSHAPPTRPTNNPPQPGQRAAPLTRPHSFRDDLPKRRLLAWTRVGSLLHPRTTTSFAGSLPRAMTPYEGTIGLSADATEDDLVYAQA